MDGANRITGSLVRGRIETGEQDLARTGHTVPASWVPLLPDTTTIGEEGLSVGGCLLEELAATHGTPLYVYDEFTLRAAAQRARAAFGALGARISFAAKACGSPAILRIFQQEGLGLDIVSEGELQAGLRAGFRPCDMHLHGNCKSTGELDAAVKLGLHAIVLDGEEEIERLEKICERQGMTIRVMTRVTLPLEAATHPHLQTSGTRSKFGLFHPSEAEQRVWECLSGSRVLQFVGLHAHLGSQISDRSIYGRAAEELCAIAETLTQRGLESEEISVGGGWAVPYAPGDPALSPETVAQVLEPIFLGRPLIRPAVEPGRALVARAAVAVYRVGSVKVSGDRRIIAVDGGMGDNPRPALYGARYSVLPATSPFSPSIGPADVAGRYCESGDILVRDALLPRVTAGDLLCVPVSGAYQLSMASAYNLVPQPAAVLVTEGRSRLITRRATVEDLLSREILDGG